jgi:hypothetical protein
VTVIVVPLPEALIQTQISIAKVVPEPGHWLATLLKVPIELETEATSFAAESVVTIPTTTQLFDDGAVENMVPALPELTSVVALALAVHWTKVTAALIVAPRFFA